MKRPNQPTGDTRSGFVEQVGVMSACHRSAHCYRSYPLPQTTFCASLRHFAAILRALRELERSGCIIFAGGERRTPNIELNIEHRPPITGSAPERAKCVFRSFRHVARIGGLIGRRGFPQRVQVFATVQSLRGGGIPVGGDADVLGPCIGKSLLRLTSGHHIRHV